LSKFDQQVSLNISRPHTLVAAYGAILFVVACIICEMVARTPFVQSKIPYQAYGINHAQMELQLNNINHFVEEHGAPDCLVFGSSQAFREVNTDVFAQAFATANGEKITCYNFGVTGSQIWSTSIFSKILIQKYHPRLVIIGTSFLDYTEGREADINERFLDNNWLKYKTDGFTLGGWLTEHSYAWRAITLLSYAAPYGLKYEEVLREAHKWEGAIADSGYALSDKYINPKLPADDGFVKNFQQELGNFGISERNMSALEETIAFSKKAGAQVIIVEMAYHPALLELIDARRKPRLDKEQMLSFIGSVNSRLHDIAKDHGIFFLEFNPQVSLPDTGWFDLYHLNLVGADVFSLWLGDQVGQIIGSLPPVHSTNGVE
jgi:hypothetical protein